MGPRAVLVTGAGGNLGSKTIAMLAGREWCETIYCLDVKPMEGGVFSSEKCRPIVADLADPRDRRWLDACRNADAIAHFAVRNPAPSGSWDDTVLAIDMTANLLANVKPEGCRFLFASSNHTMGQYKDLDWSGLKLSAATPPLPGTRFFAGGDYHQPNMYGGSKLLTERLLRAKAIASAGRFTAVSLRIGWCLAGDGDPHRINTEGGGVASGGHSVQPPDEVARDLVWFRNMWLSNRDFAAEFEAAFTADAARWPDPAIVVNGVSANRGTLWDMADAAAWLGHVPKDDVWTVLGLPPGRSPFER
jgi:nucleoside-diphosphate-sugar epimerase